MNYPKRGRKSGEGKYYTHTDGSVHDLGHPKDHVSACKGCSLVSACNETSLEKGLLCGQRGPYQKIEGAYVPTDEEQAACINGWKEVPE